MTLGWALFVGLWFYEFLIAIPLEEVWSVLITGTSTAAFAVVVYLVLLPELNKAFKGSATVRKVDPNAISVIAIFGSSMVASYMGRKVFRKKSNPEKDDDEEEELMTN